MAGYAFLCGNVLPAVLLQSRCRELLSRMAHPLHPRQGSSLLLIALYIRRPAYHPAYAMMMKTKIVCIRRTCGVPTRSWA